MKTCSSKKADGTPCLAHAAHGSRFCFFHDPAKHEAVREAGRAGGSQGKLTVLPQGTPEVPLASVADVTRLLAMTINQVRRGEIDPKPATTIGYLAGLLLKSIEQGAFEDRLAALEATVAKTAKAAAPQGLAAVFSRPGGSPR